MPNPPVASAACLRTASISSSSLDTASSGRVLDADPAADRTSAGTLTVRGTAASAWNRGQSGDAIYGVSLEGSLPPKRITARRSGGRVKGRISDRFGHPVFQVLVELQRRAGGGWRRAAKGFTTTRGAYSLGGARRSGSYRVVAKLGGTTARRAVR